jgi:GTPase SAR1 family protein
MGSQQNLPRAARDIKFRVLIIGRANAGKTSILQRVCNTTEDPEIYSVDAKGVRSRVRSHSPLAVTLPISSSHQVQQLDVTMQVGQA